MIHTIWLQLILGAGNKRLIKILNKFGNSENVFKASLNDIAESKLFTSSEISKIKKIGIAQAKSVISKCKKEKIKILTYFDKTYPDCLRNIPNPPLVLYYKGEFPDFDNLPTITIVGPRKVSDYGKRAAISLSSRLARAGFLIISGGALGTDSYAHMGALKYKCPTVIVMGCGINYNYLSENEPMRRAALENHGCLISEYPPDTAPKGYNFPIRNRIMSALSLGTVVIEAGIRSGALITANHALEQGKDVFVVPGTPGLAQYKGSNVLLREGAIPLIDTSDIFNEYITRFPDKIDIERAYLEEKTNQKEEKNKKYKKIFDISLSKEAKMIYNQLDKQQFYPDDINRKNLTDDEILAALIELEISGVIKSLPGGKYEVV